MENSKLFKPAHIALSNWREPDHIKWALGHFSFMPTLDVARGGTVSDLPAGPKNDIEAFALSRDDWSGTLLDALHADGVDGYIVIKDGRVLYERYFGAFQPHDKHLWASATKSIVGSVFGILVEKYGVELEKSPADYIPALANSAFAQSSLRQVLNMVTSLDYSEDYLNMTPGAVHTEYFRRLGFFPAWDLMQVDPRQDDTPRGVRGFLPKFQRNPNVPHGTTYEYHSPNVDVIGWVIETVSGLPLAEFVRKYLWSHMQTEHDAFFRQITNLMRLPRVGSIQRYVTRRDLVSLR